VRREISELRTPDRRSANTRDRIDSGHALRPLGTSRWYCVAISEISAYNRSQSDFITPSSGAMISDLNIYGRALRTLDVRTTKIF
jgi:hypothetical protein